MRFLVIPFVALVLGCGGGTPTTLPPATDEEDKAEEERIKQEARREGKARKLEKSDPDEPAAKKSQILEP